MLRYLFYIFATTKINYAICGVAATNAFLEALIETTLLKLSLKMVEYNEQVA